MGGKNQTTTSQVTIPQDVLDRYNSVNAQAQAAAANPFQKWGNNASDFVAQLNDQQKAGMAGVDAAAGSYQPYFDNATAATTAGMGPANLGELNIDKYMSPYTRTVADTTANIMGQQNEQAQSGALGNAASSGAFGGDRAGIAAANLSQQQNLAMGSTMANIMNQGYTQALGAAQQQQGAQLSADQANLERQMQGGAQMAGLGTAAQQAGLQGAEAQMAAGAVGQQTEQAGKTALINQFMQQQGYPFQIAQFLANIAEGTGALSGSTTTTTQPQSWWSDRRLKYDIRPVGHKNGLPVYQYKYRGDASRTIHTGHMADEVENVAPHAVGLDPSGYKTVDYKRLASGGPAGPYAAPVGSVPGVGSYVPDGYLPVGDLMMADPALQQQAQQTLMDQINAAVDAGTKIVDMKKTLGDLMSAGKASGGAVEAPPVTGLGYLQPTIEAQGKADKPQLLQAAQPSQGGGGSSPLGSIASIGQSALGIMKLLPLLKDGGRVGYADGGSPMDDLSAAWQAATTTKELPGTLGDAIVSKIGSANADRMHEILQGYDHAAGIGVPPLTGPAGHDLGASMPPPAPPPNSGQVYGQLPDANVQAEALGRAEQSTAHMAATEPPIPAPKALGFDATHDSAPAPGLGVSGGAAAATPPTPATPGLAPATPLAHPVSVPMAHPVSAPTSAPETLAAPDINQPDPAMSTPPSNTPMANTGKVPSGGYTPIIPLKTQVDFALTEPEWGNYSAHQYRTPEQAAIGMDTYFEISGGKGNAQAASNARKVYDAAQSGDMSALPPNVQEAYNRLIERGVDPIKASGAVGRWMVESYGHLDPNARSVMGGGNGSIGIAQWRGPRMAALADYAGIPLDAITGMPVSTPEGRYYSTGLGSSRERDTGVNMSGLGAAGAGNRAYADRNQLGQLMHDPTTNKLNKNALLSILSGIGTMASSPSRYLGASILQGLGGFANTAIGLQAQQPDIAAQNIENMRAITNDTMSWNALHPDQQLSPEQYARMNNISMPDISYTPTTGGAAAGIANTGKTSFSDYQNGTVTRGGVTMRNSDDPSYLQKFISDYGFVKEGPVASAVQTARDRLAAIQTMGGQTIDVNGNQIIAPGYTAPGDALAKVEANRIAAAALRDEAAAALPSISSQLTTIDHQTQLFSQLPGDAFNTAKGQLSAALSSLGIPVSDDMLADPAKVQEAIKMAADQTIAALNTMPGGAPAAEMSRLAEVSANPNLQPEALKMILVMKKAALLQQQARYNTFISTGATDRAAFEAQFAQEHPYDEFYKKAEQSMPKFAGESGSSPANPVSIGSDADWAKLPGGTFYKGPDGLIRQKPAGG